MADVIETDYTTNPPTITERAFTPAEIAQREADVKAAAEAVKVAEQRAADRAVLLKRLGLSESEVRLLLGA